MTPLYRGDAVECSCCGARWRKFGPLASRPNRICWTCGSLERHRQIALLFRERPDMLHPDMRVLHIAPEPAVRRLVPAGAEYVAGDLEPGPGQVKVDVTAMDFADQSIDALLCNHVMEHVPEDRAAMREIHRVLKPGGWGIVMTPITVERTDEDPSVTDPKERLRRWGQHDHVRRYGWDYTDRLREAGLEVEIVRTEDPDTVRRYQLRNTQGFVEPLFLARRI
jgi:SAM-dependent methyltransferase